MSLYRLQDTTHLVEPVMIAAFDGWIDASSAASGAAGHLAEGAPTVAVFDADLIYDYRSRRPVLDVIDGTLTRLVWPEMRLARTQAGGRDLLILHGAEPDFRWHELGSDIVELVLRLGVTQWVSLGAIPAAVPHTRPTPVLATASADGLLHDYEVKGPEGLLRVPAAALSALEMTVIDSGLGSVGFFAQVPHYVGGPWAPATIALLDHLGRHLGVELPLGELPDEAVSQRGRVDALVQDQDEAREYLERLEELPSEGSMPSGDDIASEIERFLQGNEG
jgi:proteasome assembly chaperone (PAC2) family protein